MRIASLLTLIGPVAAMMSPSDYHQAVDREYAITKNMGQFEVRRMISSPDIGEQKILQFLIQPGRQYLRNGFSVKQMEPWTSSLVDFPFARDPRDESDENTSRVAPMAVHRPFTRLQCWQTSFFNSRSLSFKLYREDGSGETWGTGIIELVKETAMRGGQIVETGFWHYDIQIRPAPLSRSASARRSEPVEEDQDANAPPALVESNDAREPINIYCRPQLNRLHCRDATVPHNDNRSLLITVSQRVDTNWMRVGTSIGHPTVYGVDLASWAPREWEPLGFMIFYINHARLLS